LALLPNRCRAVCARCGQRLREVETRGRPRVDVVGGGWLDDRRWRRAHVEERIGDLSLRKWAGGRLVYFFEIGR
jgi:hypothetical protein